MNLEQVYALCKFLNFSLRLSQNIAQRRASSAEKTVVQLSSWPSFRYRYRQ